MEGVGICRLPELYVRDFIESGQLVPILEEFRSDPLPVWMVYPNARYTPAKVRLFIDYFCENIERLAQYHPGAMSRQRVTPRFDPSSRADASAERAVTA